MTTCPICKSDALNVPDFTICSCCGWMSPSLDTDIEIVAGVVFCCCHPITKDRAIEVAKAAIAALKQNGGKER